MNNEVENMERSEEKKDFRVSRRGVSWMAVLGLLWAALPMTGYAGDSEGPVIADLRFNGIAVQQDVPARITNKGYQSVNFTVTDSSGVAMTYLDAGDLMLTRWGTAEGRVYGGFNPHRIANGEHRLKLVSLDNVGNATTIDVPLIVDFAHETGPAITNLRLGSVSWPMETPVRIEDDRSLSVAFTVADPNGVGWSHVEIGDRMLYRWRGEGSFRTTLDPHTLPNGEHVLKVASWDGDDNRSVIEIPLLVNFEHGVPPAISDIRVNGVEWPAGEILRVNEAIERRIEFNVSDISGIDSSYVKLDDLILKRWTTESGALTVYFDPASFSDGEHLLKIASWDSKGNESVVEIPVFIELDREVRPSVGEILIDGKPWGEGTTIRIEDDGPHQLQFTNNQGGSYVDIDDVMLRLWRYPGTYRISFDAGGLSNGEHVLKVTGPSTIEERGTLRIPISVDIAPPRGPEIQLTLNGETLPVDRPLVIRDGLTRSLRVTVSDPAGVQSNYVDLGNVMLREWSSDGSFFVTLKPGDFPNGEHVLKLASWDRHHHESVVTIPVIIDFPHEVTVGTPEDMAGPEVANVRLEEVALSADEPLIIRDKQNKTLKFSVSDPSGVMSGHVDLDNVRLQSWYESGAFSAVFDPQRFGNGEHVLTFVSRDRKGNESVNRFSVRVDLSDDIGPVIGGIEVNRIGWRAGERVVVDTNNPKTIKFIVSDALGVRAGYADMGGKRLTAWENAGTFNAVVSPQSFDNGEYMLKIVAWDTKGNRSMVEIPVSIEADRELAPEVTDLRIDGVPWMPGQPLVIRDKKNYELTFGVRHAWHSLSGYVELDHRRLDLWFSEGSHRIVFDGYSLDNGEHMLRIFNEGGFAQQVVDIPLIVDFERGLPPEITEIAIDGVPLAEGQRLLIRDQRFRKIETEIEEPAGISQTYIDIDNMPLAVGSSSGGLNTSLDPLQMGNGESMIKVVAWDRHGNRAVREVPVTVDIGHVEGPRIQDIRFNGEIWRPCEPLLIESAALLEVSFAFDSSNSVREGYVNLGNARLGAWFGKGARRVTVDPGRLANGLHRLKFAVWDDHGHISVLTIPMMVDFERSATP